MYKILIFSAIEKKCVSTTNLLIFAQANFLTTASTLGFLLQHDEKNFQKHFPFSEINFQTYLEEF